MRRNVGGHTHGNTHRTVDQQVGEARRQNRRLLGATVVVVLEVDGFFVDIANHFQRQRSHLGFGVTRSSCRVVTGRAEVTLTESQWVAQRPGLNQTNKCVINCRVTVWVELTHDVTDDTSTLGECLVGAVATVIHRVDHTTVNGLEAVTNVGKCATHDHAHCVVEVGTLHLQLQVNLLDAVLSVFVSGDEVVVRCQGNAHPLHSSG